MTNQQENRLSMYLSFKDFQTLYTTITDTLPNYKTNSSTFANTIPEIQRIAEQQKTSKKGYTAEKNTYKETLIVVTADYARKLGAFAKFSDNPILAQEIKFNESKLRQSADTAVRDYAQIAYDRAQANVAALGIYGISADTQAALLNTINAYNASLGKPGANRTEIGQLTRQLENLFKTADSALKNMDLAIQIIRLTHNDFYLSYKNARKVIVRNTGSLAVKGRVTDVQSNKPIKGASLSFLPENRNSMPKTARKITDNIVKKTAEKGGFKIKSLPPGIYTVAVKKVGYADQVGTVAVANGELTRLNIQLSKNQVVSH